jgi:protein kinase-like protein/KAP-like P-loop domain-containing protein
LSDAPAPASAPLLDDQPSAVDLLNFGEFASALREVVLNPHTRTPFIIGVFGRWGTGKTTLLQMVERDVRQRGATTTWFTAWLYNQEKEIWAAFLQSLVSRIAAELPLLDKIRFSAAVYRRGLRGERLLYDGGRLVVRAALVAAPLFMGAVLATSAASGLLATLLQSAGAAGSAILAAWYLIRPALRGVRARGAVDFSLYRSVDFEQHVGFLDRFREQFARMVAALPRSRQRLVVFVDDLDRCGPDKALQLLDAIKVFLDVPGCIFVLGMDVAVIQRALATKYPDDPVARKEYLSKIVQLPFQLPPLTEEDLQRYVRGLDVSFPDPRCREVFLAALSGNPREIKRVINTFSLHWYLAQARAIGQAVTPVRLAKVVVIQQAHPPLFELLRDSPQLLAILEAQLRGPAAGAGAPPAPHPYVSSVTQVLSPSGAALPAALSPFEHDAGLIRLLTMHPLDGAGADDTSFARLSGEEIAVYFTLARGTRTTATGAAAVPAGAEVAGAEDFQRFGARYRVLKRLAAGGSGVIFLAEDRQTGGRVAIKQLVTTLANDPSWVARFAREAQILAQLSTHPNIVRIVDTGTGADGSGPPVPYYAMEYLPGESLDALLAREGSLPPGRAADLIAPIFDALGHLHAAKVLHRDLKPSSIVVTGDGTPKLADFGLAVQPVEGRDGLTRAGFVLGTPAYMSPEQVRDEPLDPRSDLFSLGLVVYESVTGQNPVKGDSVQATISRLLQGPLPPPSSLVPGLPPAFDTFCARILARRREDRFNSADEAKAALVESLRGPAPTPIDATGST